MSDEEKSEQEFFDDLAAVVRKILPKVVEIDEVQRVKVEPRDVVVVECQHHMPPQALVNVREQLQQIWPNNRVVVVDQGLKLKVLRERQVVPIDVSKECDALATAIVGDFSEEKPDAPELPLDVQIAQVSNAIRALVELAMEANDGKADA